MLAEGVIAAAFTLGLRHGVDWDHLAAIGDLAAGGSSRRRSLLLGTVYAAAHGAVVLVLGTVVVLLGGHVPDALDPIMDRVVGVTLIVLGLAVAVGLARERGDFRPRSRWLLAADAFRAVRGRGEVVVIEHEHGHDHGGLHDHDHDHDEQVEHAGDGPLEAAEQARVVAPAAVGHRHRHRHVALAPQDPDAAGLRPAAMVGLLHGVGAETPTQLLLFVTAAGAGRGAGMLAVLAFIGGVFVTNTGIALAAVAGLTGRARPWALQLTLGVLTAAISIGLGLLYLTGTAGELPVIIH